MKKRVFPGMARAAAIALVSFLVLCGGCAKKSDTTVTGAKPSAKAPAVTAKEKPIRMSPAAEFAADVVHVQGTQRSTGKTYVKGNKSRTEITEGSQKRITIVRGDKKVVWVLDPTRKTYMEMANLGSAFQASPEAEKKLEELGERKLVGKETVNGYACDKYDFVYHDKSMGTQTQWMSRKLGVMIKLEYKSSGFPITMELKNLKEGGVADSLFELPAGYKKLEIPAVPGAGGRQKIPAAPG